MCVGVYMCDWASQKERGWVDKYCVSVGMRIHFCLLLMAGTMVVVVWRDMEIDILFVSRMKVIEFKHRKATQSE